MATHPELDQRSLALHRLIEQKIRQDPALLMRARQTLARWRASASPRSQAYLEEWQQLIDSSVGPCLAVATEDSEHATALRQSSPLSCLLSPQERFAFLRQWQQTHATA